MNIRLSVMVAYLMFIFQGLTSPLGSVMIMEIAEKYNAETSVIGYVFALGIVGGGIAAFSSAYLLEILGKRRLISVGAISAVLACIAITSSTNLTIFAVGMFLSGASSWFLVAVANYIIIEQYQGKQRSMQLNRLNSFFSIGAIITPTLAGFMLARGIRWEVIFLIPVALLALLTILTYLPSFVDSQVSKVVSSKALSSPVAEGWGKNIYLTGAALGFYCLLELSYTSWIVVYLRDNLAFDIVAASLVLTIFFICQAIGRLISGSIVKYMALHIYIIVCTFVSFSAACILLVSKSYIMILLLTIVLGLGLAGLYPSILSYGTLQVKHASPRITTFFMTTGIVGAAFGMLLTSFLKQQFGVLACLATTAITALLVIGCIAVTRLQSRPVPRER